MEVWDSDFVLPNDVLGSLRLSLNRTPRGAKFAQRCSLEQLRSSSRLSLVRTSPSIVSTLRIV